MDLLHLARPLHSVHAGISRGKCQTDWLPACRIALKAGKGEEARMWIAVWEHSGKIDPPARQRSVRGLAVVALKYGFPSIAATIIRRVPLDERWWAGLIRCAILDCRSAPAVKWLCKLSASLSSNDPTQIRRWRTALSEAMYSVLLAALEKNDTVALRICLRMFPDGLRLLVFRGLLESNLHVRTAFADQLWVMVNHLDAEMADNLLRIVLRDSGLGGKNTKEVRTTSRAMALLLGGPT
jgi:hypothetical protein